MKTAKYLQDVWQITVYDFKFGLWRILTARVKGLFRVLLNVMYEDLTKIIMPNILVWSGIMLGVVGLWALMIDHLNTL